MGSFMTEVGAGLLESCREEGFGGERALEARLARSTVRMRFSVWSLMRVGGAACSQRTRELQRSQIQSFARNRILVSTSFVLSRLQPTEEICDLAGSTRRHFGLRLTGPDSSHISLTPFPNECLEGSTRARTLPITALRRTVPTGDDWNGLSFELPAGRHL